jgi:hypothetical protein
MATPFPGECGNAGNTGGASGNQENPRNRLTGTAGRGIFRKMLNVTALAYFPYFFWRETSGG